MNILEYLRENILICDGAMGTRLQEKGLVPSGPPEELNITCPDAIVEIHREYLEAGAQIILTHTFGANPLKLARYGREDGCEKFNLAAAKNALAAKQNFSTEGAPIFIAGDIGPLSGFPRLFPEAKPVPCRGRSRFLPHRDIFKPR